VPPATQSGEVGLPADALSAPARPPRQGCALRPSACGAAITDQNPIINDPFAQPTRHWHFGDGAPSVRDGRRVAGYIPPMVKGGQLQITDELVTLEEVNRIRDRVREWREGGYPGATQVTKSLFDHWFDDEREMKPFFAQREAIETLRG
jgi:type III restriction enzyme